MEIEPTQSGNIDSIQ